MLCPCKHPALCKVVSSGFARTMSFFLRLQRPEEEKLNRSYSYSSGSVSERQKHLTSSALATASRTHIRTCDPAGKHHACLTHHNTALTGPHGLVSGSKVSRYAAGREEGGRVRVGMLKIVSRYNTIYQDYVDLSDPTKSRH